MHDALAGRALAAPLRRSRAPDLRLRTTLPFALVCVLAGLRLVPPAVAGLVLRSQYFFGCVNGTWGE